MCKIKKERKSVKTTPNLHFDAEVLVLFERAQWWASAMHQVVSDRGAETLGCVMKGIIIDLT